MNGRAPAVRLVRPAAEHLAGYTAALQRGWSPDNIRGLVATREELAAIAADAAGFLAGLHDPEARGAPITMPDGAQVQRLPGFRWWLWDDAAPGEEGFAGSIGLRWPKDLGPLPPHVLGHIGYAVVPWKRNRGFATAGLALMLAQARALGLRSVDLTTDPDNMPSQRVIAANGGVFLESFQRPPMYGGTPAQRWRIALG